MYDSIIAADVPPDGDAYLGYDDGHWPDGDELASRFPGKLVLRATVFPGDNEGDVGDCETGDMDVPGLVSWVYRRRLSGHPNPLAYFSLSLWPTVRTWFRNANVPEPGYIIADYDGDPTIPPEWIALGCVGKQWQSDTAHNFDTGTLINYIQGFDMAPAPATDDEVNDWVRALIIDYWGDEPSVVEQEFTAQYYRGHGLDLTRAAVYDHSKGVAFRQRRGW